MGRWSRARFDGSFARGPLGLREPTGERLGVEAIGTAALVLVPGLAVDRRGIRLGRGAGYYDRSLPFARGSLVMLLTTTSWSSASRPSRTTTR